MSPCRSPDMKAMMSPCRSPDMRAMMSPCRSPDMRAMMFPCRSPDNEGHDVPVSLTWQPESFVLDDSLLNFESSCL